MKVAFFVFAMIIACAASSAIVRPAYGYGGYGGYVAAPAVVSHSYYTPSYYHATPVVYHQPVVKYVSTYGHHGYGLAHGAYPAYGVSPYYGGVAPWIKKK